MIHFSIVFFTALSIWETILFREVTLLFSVYRGVLHAQCQLLSVLRQLCGTTMRVRRKIGPCEEIESSSFTCLYSLTTTESHLLLIKSDCGAWTF